VPNLSKVKPITAILSREVPRIIGTIQIPVDSSEETPGGGRMVI